jgi:hypothetical protein
MEALDEEEDPKLQQEVAPVDKGPPTIVELSSSDYPKNTKGQSETESGSTYQAKKIDVVHHFMDIRKMGANIKKKNLPKNFEHDTSQTRMISVVDYEKGILNIVVMEPKEWKKVTNISIDLNAVHPMDKFDCHRQSAEILNRDIIIENLGIKNLQIINEKLITHLKNKKLANRTRQMRVEDLEQWVMDLGANP